MLSDLSTAVSVPQSVGFFVWGGMRVCVRSCVCVVVVTVIGVIVKQSGISLCLVDGRYRNPL